MLNKNLIFKFFYLLGAIKPLILTSMLSSNHFVFYSLALVFVNIFSPLLGCGIPERIHKTLIASDDILKIRRSEIILPSLLVLIGSALIIYLFGCDQFFLNIPSLPNKLFISFFIATLSLFSFFSLSFSSIIRHSSSQLAYPVLFLSRSLPYIIFAAFSLHANLSLSLILILELLSVFLQYIVTLTCIHLKGSTNSKKYVNLLAYRSSYVLSSFLPSLSSGSDRIIASVTFPQSFFQIYIYSSTLFSLIGSLTNTLIQSRASLIINLAKDYKNSIFSFAKTYFRREKKIDFFLPLICLLILLLLYSSSFNFTFFGSPLLRSDVLQLCIIQIPLVYLSWLSFFYYAFAQFNLITVDTIISILCVFCLAFLINLGFPLAISMTLFVLFRILAVTILLLKTSASNHLYICH